MTILHIVSSVSRNAGGPARSVQGLVAAQCAAGIDAWLMTLKDLGDPWVTGIKNYRCAKCPGARGVRAAVEKVIDECKPDLVEVHSLWQTNLHQAVVAARAKGVPYVLTPRGCLDVWSLQQKWLKKKLALMTYQGRDLRHAVAVHTTSDEESRQVRRLGYDCPLLQFPNGVNLPDELPAKTRAGSRRRMLFLSRMHPKKGVMELVEAWASLKQSTSRQIDQWACELVYTMGSDDERAYEAKVKQRVLDLGMTHVDAASCRVGCDEDVASADFVFTGPLDDRAKWAAYRRADCFVLPTHTENFGIVIAEALYAELPVITTKGAPWQELEKTGSGWWIDLSVKSLAEALNGAMDLPNGDLREMGRRGKELVVSRYSWNQIAQGMKSAYAELIA